MTRSDTGTFAPHQVDLLQTFADQAVIAIENVRLFNETQEALERQTATADILKVIASSPDDVQPVFEAIAERSNRLIEGLSTAVYSIVDDTHAPDGLHAKQSRGRCGACKHRSRDHCPRLDLGRSDPQRRRSSRFLTLKYVEWAEQPALRKMARLRGFRGLLFIPLLRDGTTIGMICVTRKQPGTFAASHVQLLQTFADQAVIAIENTRLFNETQEALEAQTATAEVLQGDRRSMSDTAAGLRRILDQHGTAFRLRMFRSSSLLAMGCCMWRHAVGTGYEVDRQVFSRCQSTDIGSRVCWRATASLFSRRDEWCRVPSSNDDVAGVWQFFRRDDPNDWEGKGIGVISVLREPNAAFTPSRTQPS